MATENGSPAKRPKLSAEGDAPSEGDSIIQSALEEIDACQNEIDSLNEKASEEILCVEQKYNKLRKPFYTKRNNFIKGIKHFWMTAFSNHPQLHHVLTEQDRDCLQKLSVVEVEEFEDIKSGYKINFTFDENSYFTNTLLSKVFHLGTSGVPTCTSTPIGWKENMDLTKKGTNKKGYRQGGFFQWIQDTSDPATDEVAEVIKDDIWPNPLQYFLSNDSMENGFSDEEENADESVVVLDDEDEDFDDEDDEEGEIYEVDDDDDDDDEILEDTGDYETLDAVGDEDSQGAIHVLDDDEEDDDDDVQEITEETPADEPDGATAAGASESPAEGATAEKSEAAGEEKSEPGGGE